jgi:hypothetical protein
MDRRRPLLKKESALMEPKMNVVTLETIARGAAPELFQEELSKVIKNILDPNTEAEAKRQITLTFTFYPSEDRESCATDVGVSRKDAPVHRASTTLFLGIHMNEPVAIEQDPKQMGLFEQPPKLAAITAQKGTEG